MSLALHLLLIGALFLPRRAAPPVATKRGDSLFIELPKPEETAASPGVPTVPVPAAPKAPPTPPAPPAPRVAAAAPATKPSPSRPEPRPSPPAAAKSSARAVRGSSAPPGESATPAATSPTQAPETPTPPSQTTTPTPEPKPVEEAERHEPAPSREAPRVAAARPPEPPAPPAPPALDIKSALRRGGPGGAGGVGEGRGGIMGDPIPLDTSDSRYSDYFMRIKRMIEANMVYPCVKNPSTLECEFRSEHLTIEFGILRDGRLQFVEVTEGAGEQVFDAYSVNAIKLASPFPPVPAALMAALQPGSTGVPVRARFIYTLETSYRRIIR